MSNFLIYFCFAALAVLLPILVFSWLAGFLLHPLGNLLGRFRGLHPLARVLVLVCALKGILFGGSKFLTNDTDRVDGGVTNGIEQVEGETNDVAGALLGFAGFSSFGLPRPAEADLSDGTDLSFAVGRMGTGERIDFSADAAASVVGVWHTRGAVFDWRPLDLYGAATNASQAVGWPTNGCPVLDVPGILAGRAWAVTTDGRVVSLGRGAEGSPLSGYTNVEFSVCRLPLAVVPEGNWNALPDGFSPSRVWYDMTSRGSLRVTWENLFPDRDTNRAVRAQVEFERSGDVVYRYDFGSSGSAVGNAAVGITVDGRMFGLETNDVAIAVTPELTSVTWHAISGDGLDDEDEDGVAAIDELTLYGTSPSLYDTDGDGVNDADEIARGTDPRIRDTDDDGFVDGSDPDPLVLTPSDDLDGDGIPDAYERHWFGETNVVDSDDAADGTGFSLRTKMSAGINPVEGAPPGFVDAEGTLAGIRLWDPFAADSFACGEVVLERTLELGKATGWQHYFLSSSPSGAGGWDLRGMVLEWTDGVASGLAAASPADDSLPLPLTNGVGSVTFRLRATESRVRSARPVYLLGHSPRVEFGGRSVSDDAGRLVAVVLTNGAPAEVSVSIDRSSRPCRAPLSEDEKALPGLTELESGDESGFEYRGDEYGGVAYVSHAGVYDLPDCGVDAPSGRVAVRAVSRGEATSPVLVVLCPSVSFGGEHTWISADLSYDWTAGGYYVVRRYPLNSRCLWREWHRDGTGRYVCWCTPSVVTGVGDCPFVTTECTADGDTAQGSVWVHGEEVWRGEAKHAPGDLGGGGSRGTFGVELLTELKACETCESTCLDGKCDYGDDTSLDSVKFRVSLGSPRQGQNSGFVYFDTDVPVAVTTELFKAIVRDDAAVTISTNGDVRIFSCADSRGRDVIIEPIADGVRLTVNDHATGSLDDIWEVVNVAADTSRMRIRQISRLANVMRDETFAFAEGVWSRTDNIAGVCEELLREDSLNDGGGVSETRTRRDAEGRLLDRVVSEFSRIGERDSAVLRETFWSRETGRGVKWRRASYWDDPLHMGRHGRLRLIWGSGASWEYHDYDSDGFETLLVEQRNGSPVPGRFPSVGADGSVVGNDCLSDAKVTVFGYVPVPDDDGDADDCDRPRSQTEYVVRDGVATCVSKTWYRYSRERRGNYDAVKEERWRASSPDASWNDADNAYSYEIRFSETGMSVPLAMRGLVSEELDEDGVLTVHSVEEDDGAVREEVRRSYGGVPYPTYDVIERDAVYGNVLRRAELLTEDGTVLDEETSAYDERNRLRATRYSDGTSLTNAYSCCRLLWSSDRCGRRVLRSAVTGFDGLYYGEEDVWIRGICTNGMHRVRQTFCDGLGRETNLVVYVASAEGEAVDFAASDGRVVAETTVSYPYGADESAVVIDVRGKRTVRDVAEFADRKEDVVSVFDAEGRLASREERVSVRGGSESVKTSWDGKWRRQTTIGDFGADGCGIGYTVVESSDYGTVTNLETRQDFLGRTVLSRTPIGTTVYSFEGSTGRCVSESFSSGPVVRTKTRLYDGFGREVGEVVDGVTNRSDSVYRRDGTGAVWRVTRNVVVGPSGATNALSETHVRLTGVGGEDGLREERVSFGFDGVHSVLRRTADPVTGVEDTVVSNSATGVSWTRKMCGVMIARGDESETDVFSYDPLGRCVLVSHVTADSNEILPSAGFGYNAADDVVWTMTYTNGVSGSVECRGYDAFGHPVAVTNAVGGVVTTAYDGAGNAVETGGAATPLRSAFDTEGRRISLATTRDGLSWDETRWTYDPATGRCLSKTYADASQSVCSFTSDGLVLRMTDPSGAWREWTYDERRLPVAITSSDGSQDAAFGYDEFGRLVSSSGGVFSVEAAFGSGDVATNEWMRVGDGCTELFRRLDQEGRVMARGIAGGYSQNVSYASAGRVQTITGEDAAVTYAYGADGRDCGCRIDLPGGARIERQVVRDAFRGLVVSVSNFVNGVAVGGYDCGYDANGRLVSRNGVTYVWTERNELAAVSSGGNEPDDGEAYSYDAAGNFALTADASGSRTFEANELNQYLGLAYGGDGSLSAFDGKSFSYDSAGRLVDVSTGGVSVAHYAYAPDGRRVEKVTSEGVHRYFYDGWNLVKEVVANANGVTNVIEYLWGCDLSGTLDGACGVGGLVCVKRNGALYVPFYDPNGSVVGYVDSTGAVVAQYAYDGFGRTVSASGAMADEFAFRYSTKYWDSESGLLYYGRRHYLPALGRWLTRDPMNEDGDANLYRFCGNDGVTSYDLLGLLTAVEASEHYRHGPDDPSNPDLRTPLRISFDDIDTSSVRPSSFPQMVALLSQCEKGEYRIKWRSGDDNLAFSVSNGDTALFLGDVSLKLEGTLKVNQSGDWRFSGTLKCFDDFYDFNPSTHRGLVGETLTAIGRSLFGKPYWIEIRGSKQIEETGNCCSFNEQHEKKRWWY